MWCLNLLLTQSQIKSPPPPKTPPSRALTQTLLKRLSSGYLFRFCGFCVSRWSIWIKRFFLTVYFQWSVILFRKWAVNFVVRFWPRSFRPHWCISGFAGAGLSKMCFVQQIDGKSKSNQNQKEINNFKSGILFFKGPIELIRIWVLWDQNTPKKADLN